jgi:hypothetical protein
MSEENILKVAMAKFENVSLIVNLFTMQFEWVGDDISKMFGYSAGELTGTNVRDIVVIDPIALLSSMYTKDDKKEVITKSGKRITITGDVHPFMHDGESLIAVTNIVEKA